MEGLSICREAHDDGELDAAAYLRAVSFYAYPPERAFAGKVRVPNCRCSKVGLLFATPKQKVCGARIIIQGE